MNAITDTARPAATSSGRYHWRCATSASAECARRRAADDHGKQRQHARGRDGEDARNEGDDEQRHGQSIAATTASRVGSS